MQDDIRLDDQLCFALYSASRVAQGAYREVLDELDLTYPQWLVLIALWERDGQSVAELGERLLLDSGTLSPLLRRLEARGVLVRERSHPDARRVVVTLTDEGRALRGHAGELQRCLAAAVPLSADEVVVLRTLARRLVGAVPAQEPSSGRTDGSGGGHR
ncbi:MarR family transcriptional regulator [Luteipulveratus sp. YIM 133132]|uniref:MarR family transcriptional regulator n=1 Tax=Luteipulveratus flavus TaxID=3031728 RepID=A0ABT6C4A3_9MICO|nr:MULTISPECIES: MarR family transcriptional regulator [unclassified Luteipulveratus]MDE9364057.1 MarR family transcriptional regulator [Luteipulveratus sp. YIM 133132]MDF8263560.1 MarR family transcriptional regulator [Luteipulveratus sp. YIM 133296]